jgi:hypothetical protein
MPMKQYRKSTIQMPFNPRTWGHFACLRYLPGLVVLDQHARCTPERRAAKSQKFEIPSSRGANVLLLKGNHLLNIRCVPEAWCLNSSLKDRCI